MKLDEKTIQERKENQKRSVIDELLQLHDEIGIYSVIEMISGYAKFNADDLMDTALNCTNPKAHDSLKLDMSNNGTYAQLAVARLSKIQGLINDIDFINLLTGEE